MSLSDKIRELRWEDGKITDHGIATKYVREAVKEFIEDIEKIPNIQITHTTIKAKLKERFGDDLT